MVRPKIEELINNHKNSEYKIQLSMGVNFINITGEENTRTFYVKSDNEEIRLSSNTNTVAKKLFNTFLNNHQNEEQILRNESYSICESVDVLNIHFHKIDLKRGSSYINSSKWIKNKGAPINPKNTKDNRCLQYAVAVALNHQNLRNYPE